jgi:aspartate aminotransferase
MLQASQILLSDPTLNHEYLPITGLPGFVSSAARLILGEDSPAIAEGRVVSVQTISGTGANHLAALFLSRYYPFNGDKVVYLSDPTWGTFRQFFRLRMLREILHHTVNHFAIFNNVGIKPLVYPYYDPRTIALDFAGFIATLESAPERSVFLLHACAHNPTGVDPTDEQWRIIADTILTKKHYAFFDAAYQGFASGDLDRDAAAVRHFVSRGVPMLVCQVCNDRILVARSLNVMITELC